MRQRRIRERKRGGRKGRRNRQRGGGGDRKPGKKWEVAKGRRRKRMEDGEMDRTTEWRRRGGDN